MNIITYNIQLNFNQKSFDFWYNYLLQAQQAYNACAKYLVDNNTKLDIKSVHNEVYQWMRKQYNLIPAQGIIRTYKEVLAAVRSIKSNKHKDTKTPERKNLAIRLDKRLYAKLSKEGIFLTGEQKNKRQFVSFNLYQKAEKMFDNYIPKDPLIFIRDGKAFLSVPFEVPEKPVKSDTAIGVDLGMKRLYVTSEGDAFKDTKYISERRKVRYLKRKLKEKNTKSAKRHLKKLKRREHHLSNDMCQRASNELIKRTKADIIVMEDLSKIKQNTSKTKDGYKLTRHNNAISQIPFYQFKKILTYKAQLVGKRVETVSPKYTSQIDSRTGNKDGKRLGCRYYCTDGVVLDADWNAAVNIAQRSKHPVSKHLPLDGGLDFYTGRDSSASPTWK